MWHYRPSDFIEFMKVYDLCWLPFISSMEINQLPSHYFFHVARLMRINDDTLWEQRNIFNSRSHNFICHLKVKFLRVIRRKMKAGAAFSEVFRIFPSVPCASITFSLRINIWKISLDKKFSAIISCARWIIEELYICIHPTLWNDTLGKLYNDEPLKWEPLVSPFHLLRHVYLYLGT